MVVVSVVSIQVVSIQHKELIYAIHMAEVYAVPIQSVISKLE